MNDSFKGLITMLCPWALLRPAFLVQLRTVPTVVTAQIFCACQGSRARRERNAQHAGHADWFCPAVSLGGSSYFLWKRCVVFQQMKNNFCLSWQLFQNRTSMRKLLFLPYDRSDRIFYSQTDSIRKHQSWVLKKSLGIKKSLNRQGSVNQKENSSKSSA